MGWSAAAAISRAAGGNTAVFSVPPSVSALSLSRFLSLCLPLCSRPPSRVCKRISAELHAGRSDFYWRLLTGFLTWVIYDGSRLGAVLRGLKFSRPGELGSFARLADSEEVRNKSHSCEVALSYSLTRCSQFPALTPDCSFFFIAIHASVSSSVR